MSKKSIDEQIDEIVEKLEKAGHKYIKREGSAGNYVYTYADGSRSNRNDYLDDQEAQEKERFEKLSEKINVSASELKHYADKNFYNIKEMENKIGGLFENQKEGFADRIKRHNEQTHYKAPKKESKESKNSTPKAYTESGAKADISEILKDVEFKIDQYKKPATKELRDRLIINELKEKRNKTGNEARKKAYQDVIDKMESNMPKESKVRKEKDLNSPERALANDKKQLEEYKKDLKTLESGGKAGNLNIESAKRAIEGLTSAIANKEKHTGWGGTEITDKKTNFDSKKELSKEKQELYQKILTPENKKHLRESVKAAMADGNTETSINSDKMISNFMDTLTPEQYKNSYTGEIEDFLFDELEKIEKEMGMKKSNINMNEEQIMKSVLIQTIKDLGVEGLKKSLPNLTENDALLLKETLEEMKKSEAAPQAKMIESKVSDLKVQGEVANDDEDEKLVKEKNKDIKPQGDNTPEGIEGQVIKSEKMETEKEDPKKELAEIKAEAKKEKEPVEQEKKEEALEEKAEEKAPMKKSVQFDDPNKLIKACTYGRNFHFSVNDYYDEMLKKAEEKPTEETLVKSEKAYDLNDIIAKSMDQSFAEIQKAEDLKKSESEKNGRLQKSFEDEDLANAMGITVEEMKTILGE